MRPRHKGPAGYHVLRYPLYCDLQYDLNELAITYLKAAGYEDFDPEKASLQYENLRHRLIAPHPRSVKFSDVFMSTVPKGYEKVLTTFCDCIRKGKNLQPFMSMTTLQASYRDDALNALGIYHFHLSIRPGNKGFVKRNQYLILAVVDDVSVYLLKVVSHNSPWAYDRSLYEIIYRNWPELLEPFEMKDVTGFEPHLTDKDYKAVRNAHINTALEIDGHVFFGIGMGVASDGSAVIDVQSSDYWWNLCGREELVLRDCSRELMEGVRHCLTSEWKKRISCLELELKNIDQRRCILLEKQTDLVIRHFFAEGQFWFEGVDTMMKSSESFR